jgi:hypothetical protein
MHEYSSTPHEPNRWLAAVLATLSMLAIGGGFVLAFVWPNVLEEAAPYVLALFGAFVVGWLLVKAWKWLYDTFLWW